VSCVAFHGTGDVTGVQCQILELCRRPVEVVDRLNSLGPSPVGEAVIDAEPTQSGVVRIELFREIPQERVLERVLH
jgi:hypothetical protein